MTEEEPAKIPGANPSCGSAGWGVTGGQGEGDSDRPRALRMTLKGGEQGRRPRRPPGGAQRGRTGIGGDIFALLFLLPPGCSEASLNLSVFLPEICKMGRKIQRLSQLPQQLMVTQSFHTTRGYFQSLNQNVCSVLTAPREEMRCDVSCLMEGHPDCGARN